VVARRPLRGRGAFRLRHRKRPASLEYSSHPRAGRRASFHHVSQRADLPHRARPLSRRAPSGLRVLLQLSLVPSRCGGAGSGLRTGDDDAPLDPPGGPAQRLAWARDGKSLIYGDMTAGRLWRAFIAGDRPPEGIELAGLDPLQPATVAALDRLAFVQGRSSNDIYRFEVGHPPEALLESSSWDFGPHLSLDGRRIAFCSGRAGEGLEIWLADVDGSNPTQLTRGPGIWQGSPRWSPDGHRIAFDSQDETGRWDIWTIDADGGSPSRLTLDPGDENVPSWSRDGRFIYFRSDRAGSPMDVWRIPATGGPRSASPMAAPPSRTNPPTERPCSTGGPVPTSHSSPCRSAEARNERSWSACRASPSVRGCLPLRV